MNNLPCSWLSPKLESRVFLQKGGHGVFATQAIPKGELVAMFGGTVVNYDQLVSFPENLQQLSIQVEDDLFLVSTIVGPGDHFNHSCQPNVGMDGQIGLVAMHAIDVGEEITFDYAMCDSAPYDEFECRCGAIECRQHVTGDDWKRPELWDKYDGYFSPYLQRKIDLMREQEGYATVNGHKG
ncbi:MAG: SET domain-containing protein [Anaerolineae bacterium]